MTSASTRQAPCPPPSAAPTSGRRELPGAFREFRKEDLEQTVGRRFEQQVRLFPDRIALSCGAERVTYAELNRRANRLACVLRAQLPAGEQRVGLRMKEDARFAAALFACFKAGMTAVPLASSLPPARVQQILSHAEAALLLTDGDAAAAPCVPAEGCVPLDLSRLDTPVGEAALTNTVPPERPACLIHTSGSTGQPKGVIQTHRTLLRSAMAYTNGYHLCVEDRVALLASCSTAQGMVTLLATLLNGATAACFDLCEHGIAGLRAWLIRERITVFISATTVCRQLAQTLDRAAPFPDLRLVRLGSEPVRRQDLESFRDHFPAACQFINALAATETGPLTQFVAHPAADIREEVVPVGWAADEVEILLLDEQGRAVGCDEVGEIVVRGRYLSPGYWRQPELTARVFREAPEGGGARLYFTGDLGVRTGDGCLRHRGRKDLRVKIRGFGVEVAEVEAALLRHPAVRDAAVTAREDGQDGSQLAAFLVPVSGEVLDAAELRTFLQPTLAAPMVPTAFYVLEALPLTPNGKLDRSALRGETPRALTWSRPTEAPRTATERQLAELWQEVLGVTEVGIHDDFFKAGGDSLRAMRLMLAIETQLGRTLPLAALIASPTIARLALLVDRTDAGEAVGAAAVRGAAGGPHFIQVPGIHGYGFLPPAVARRVGSLCRYYDALQYAGVDGQQPFHECVEDIAAHLVAQVGRLGAPGPCCLSGYSFGGLVAYEMACQLREQGRDVALVLLWDTYAPRCFTRRSWREVGRVFGAELARLDGPGRARFATRLATRKLRATWSRWKQRLTASGWPGRNSPPAGPAGSRDQGPTVVELCRHAHRIFQPRPYPGKVVLFRAGDGQFDQGLFYGADAANAWGGVVRGELVVVPVPGDHISMVQEPMVSVLADKIVACLSDWTCQLNN